tara:strand:- start:31223 stop:31678 length:456 start_codon:yes stop_codon:yes gene_type:complete
MKNKQVGLILIGVAIIFLFVVISFNSALDEIARMSCTHGDSCPMEVTLQTQKNISYGLIGLIIISGTLLIFFMRDEEKKAIAKNIDLEKLDPREKHIMQILMDHEGSVFQSDLVKETKQSKVKITRVLDKLEGKGLIERKRRGMANIVLLK